MDAAIALPSVRVMLGHSDSTNEVASVVTVRMVPNLPYTPELRPFPTPASSRLEYVLVSVILLDAIDWSVVESAIDPRADSPKDGVRSESPTPGITGERSDGRERMGERGGRIGGTSSHSLVPVGVSPPSGSIPSAVPASLDEEAKSGLSDRSVGRPADGGVQRLVLLRVGDRGERGGEDAIKLGEDMTTREEELMRYGELRVTFALMLATAALTGLNLLPPRER
jgi:hypothetical protein